MSLVNALEGYLNSPEFEQQQSGNKNTKKSIDDLGNFMFNLVKESEKGKAIPAKDKPLIDFFNTIEEEMVGYNRAAAPEMPKFNAMWNDQFNDIQNQIQQTNQLLNQNQSDNFGQQSSFNPFGQQAQQAQFQQANFSQMNSGQQQQQQYNNPFTTANTSNDSGFNVDNVFGSSAFQPAPVTSSFAHNQNPVAGFPGNSNFGNGQPASSNFNPFQQQQNGFQQDGLLQQNTGFQQSALQQQNTGFQSQAQNPFNNNSTFGLQRDSSREDVFSSLGQTLPTMKKLQAQSTDASNFQSPMSTASPFQPMKSQMTGQSVSTSYTSPAMSSPFQQPLQNQMTGTSFQSSGLANNFGNGFQPSGLSNSFTPFQNAQISNPSQSFQPNMSFQQKPLQPNMTGSSVGFSQNNTAGLSPQNQGAFSQNNGMNNQAGFALGQNSNGFGQTSAPLNSFNSNQNGGFLAQSAAPSNPFSAIPSGFTSNSSPLNPFSNSCSPAVGFNQGNSNQPLGFSQSNAGGIANNFRAPLTNTNSTQHGYGVQNQMGTGSTLSQPSFRSGQQPLQGGFDNFGNPIQNQFLTSNTNTFA